MRYYFIAGEASGDLHASNLIRELRKTDQCAEFRGWGGDLMEQQGVTLVRHHRDLAFMGFIEVAKHLPEIFRNLSFCEKDILAWKPDVVILVDYPGFNLRIAKMAHRNGIRVFYYISPQVWAWKESRVNTIRKYVERMFVILPFEKEFYLKHNYKVDFAGHPLLDVIPGQKPATGREEFLSSNHLDSRPVIALLPGSRRMEIGKMLKIMMSIRNQYPGYQFVVAGAPSLEASFYHELLIDTDVTFVQNQTYNLLQYSVAALVTSGTATLETALWNVPQLVCYKGNRISFEIARRLVKVPYISLVNLILNRPVVKELIQNDLTSDHLVTELNLILKDEIYRENMLENFRHLKKILGGEGASHRIALLMVQYLNNKRA